MAYKLSYCLIIYLFLYTPITAQQDNVWLFGAAEINGYNSSGQLFGNTIIDFSDIDPYVYYDSTMVLDFGGTNASISSKEGDLLFYSNGMEVHGADHSPIINGEVIAYSEFWDHWNIETPNPDESWTLGYPMIQGAQIIPIGENTYYIIYNIYNKNEQGYFVPKGFYYSIIEGDEDNYRITVKDIHILSRDYDGGFIHACQHANGRDWWIYQQSILGDSIYSFLATPFDIKYNHTTPFEARADSSITLSQVAFSPDGRYFAIGQGHYLDNSNLELIITIRLLEFDRCSGQIINLGKDTMENFRLYGSIAFSPNGRMLYAANHVNLYQYDLLEHDWVKSKKLVAEYDGHVTEISPFTSSNTLFGPMALGPDGRIYSVVTGNSRYLGVVEYPNELGIEANMIQHKIELKTSNFRSTPNHPHFRMGSIDGSPCDTLGIDNHPLALFRYMQDTLEYNKVRFTDLSSYYPDTWQWDFGNGNTFAGESPYYHTFDSDGVYNVCLTVSNENSEDTYCSALYIGVVSVNNEQNEIKTQISPNPINENLNIELRNYFPSDGKIFIYNSFGRLQISTKISHSWNRIDLSNQSSGMYFYTIQDSGRNISSGKFIKL